MKQNIKVTVNGKPYAVEIEGQDGNHPLVKVNGVSYEVELEGAAPAAPALPPAPRPKLEPHHSPLKVAPASANSLAAPMPGVILDIAVKVGDKVPYGGTLCALEAMKMKNAIRASREVVIASIEVQDGQKVAYGDVLFRFA